MMVEVGLHHVVRGDGRAADLAAGDRRAAFHVQGRGRPSRLQGNRQRQPRLRLPGGILAPLRLKPAGAPFSSRSIGPLKPSRRRAYTVIGTACRPGH